MQDELYMRRCIDLAQKGRGKTGLNPLVGALLVHNNRIIGEGWHKGYGQAHAEPNALSSVSKKDRSLISKSTLYVSLEPCSHFGKTPPCTELIIQHQIPRVVIGSVDPNPIVNGRGIAKLKEAGVAVTSGVLSTDTNNLIKVFKTNQLLKRPYITIKFAKSCDGFIGKKEAAVRISDPITDFFTHRLRTEVSGIAVGRNTADIDSPQLTSRKYPGKNPMRLIFCSTKLPLPNDKTFDYSAPTIVVAPKDATPYPFNKNITILAPEETLKKTIEKIYRELRVDHLLIEGGSQLINSFLQEGLWDEIIVIESSIKLHSGITAPDLGHFKPAFSFSLKKDKVWVYQRDKW
ncbi:MAG: bifunctional diaminohydroxyphosphoribosylaminopyrimidine deaminase/5-amino-6-(5-phosphoribosylamino)uracil reductase RibD [Saprospirales bacterium]|nr:MAG: bifunctional diaminohydroxyphosphoribosylaminopyrimidine deaminase/5-amino-6-(5-phosphoribosylamino)uracil reductase RibD [Saprospirales bacterium]